MIRHDERRVQLAEAMHLAAQAAKDSSVPSRFWAAIRPTASISRGRTSSIWRAGTAGRRRPPPGCGSRLFGGRLLSTLAM